MTFNSQRATTSGQDVMSLAGDAPDPHQPMKNPNGSNSPFPFTSRLYNLISMNNQIESNYLPQPPTTRPPTHTHSSYWVRAQQKSLPSSAPTTRETCQSKSTTTSRSLDGWIWAKDAEESEASAFRSHHEHTEHRDVDCMSDRSRRLIDCILWRKLLCHHRSTLEEEEEEGSLSVRHPRHRHTYCVVTVVQQIIASTTVNTPRLGLAVQCCMYAGNLLVREVLRGCFVVWDVSLHRLFLWVMVCFYRIIGY